MYAIYGNIYHQYTQMLAYIYIPYMDPVGIVSYSCANVCQKHVRNEAIGQPSQSLSEQTKKDKEGIVHCGLQIVDAIQETSEVLAYARTMNCAFFFTNVHWLVVSPPLKNMKVSWDYDIPNINDINGEIIHSCSKPPTRYNNIYIYICII